MRRGQKFLIFYLLFFGLLSAMAAQSSPSTMFVLTIVTFGLAAVVADVSPFILLYSLALLPLWLAATNRPRRWWQIAGALLVPAVVATAPWAVSRMAADGYNQRASRDDFSHTAPSRPKTVEIIGDEMSGVFQNALMVDYTSAACSEICQRLLFNHEVEQVRMTRIRPNNIMGPDKSPSTTYHLERRASCPKIYSDAAKVDNALRERLLAGDCLVGEAEIGGLKEATISFTAVYPVPPDERPVLATIRKHRRLTINQRGEDGSTLEIVLRNELTAETVRFPFYFQYEYKMLGGDRNGYNIGRSIQITHPVDLANAMRDAFGFKIAPVEPPVPQAALK